MSAQVFGSGIRRREDPRLITVTAADLYVRLMALGVLTDAAIHINV